MPTIDRYSKTYPIIIYATIPINKANEKRGKRTASLLYTVQRKELDTENLLLVEGMKCGLLTIRYWLSGSIHYLHACQVHACHKLEKITTTYKS